MRIGMLRLVLFTLVGLAAGGALALAVFPDARERLLSPLKIRSAGQALIGGPFALTDHTGKRVTDADYRGSFMLVMFGFTFCPDICPGELQLITAALDKLGPKAARVVPIFISIDPERDTPAQLALYRQSFHPRLVALSGSAEEVAAAAKAYRVYARKVADPKSTARYTMDHSAFIYLMGPDGAYRTHFTPGISVDTLAERLAKLL